MGFPRQEYWSGLPFPPLGDLPDPEIKSASLSSPAVAGEFFTTELPQSLLLESSKNHHDHNFIQIVFLLKNIMA